MLEAETTPSETSQLSDISSVTADLDSEKPTAPPGFHWLGDKPMLEKKRFSGFPGQFHT